MSVYRRPPVTGAMVFFTVALAARGGDVLVREVGLLREAVRVTKAERPFGIEAWVVLPDHMHAVWQMPPGDRAYGVRWGAIKARFTRAVRDKYETDIPGCRPGFSPASPALSAQPASPTFRLQPAYDYPTELPVVRSGRYAGLKPGLRHDKREQAVWQRRFWEHHVRDEAEYRAFLRYCWWNPVKHGFVARPEDWPWSSVHRDGRYVPGMDLGV
ncbi:transposase [Rhodobacterales bacterium HKCCSP123]|nr:transposase [Rhodobacterales bacterium HKCCSP123]